MSLGWKEHNTKKFLRSEVNKYANKNQELKIELFEINFEIEILLKENKRLLKVLQEIGLKNKMSRIPMTPEDIIEKSDEKNERKEDTDKCIIDMNMNDDSLINVIMKMNNENDEIKEKIGEKKMERIRLFYDNEKLVNELKKKDDKYVLSFYLLSIQDFVKYDNNTISSLCEKVGIKKSKKTNKYAGRLRVRKKKEMDFYKVGDEVNVVSPFDEESYSGIIIQKRSLSPQMQYLIHYPGWSHSWNEWVVEERLVQNL